MLDKVRAAYPKELKELSAHNVLLGGLDKKQQMVDNRLLDFINKKLKFGLGQKFTDKNVTMVFNTFLREKDPLVDQEILNKLCPEPEDETAPAQ